jgi:hypothetical protein
MITSGDNISAPAKEKGMDNISAKAGTTKSDFANNRFAMSCKF